MWVDVYDSFVAMYYALDAAFDEHPTSERLRKFVSEANPFIWDGKGSADPAVYTEFRQTWGEEFGSCKVTAQEALRFVRRYLKIQDEGEYAFVPTDSVTLVEAFDSMVDDKTWKEALSNL